MNLLKKTISRLNQTLIDRAFDLKKHNSDELDRKFDWAQNNDSGIKGTFIAEDGTVTFKL